MRVSYRYARSGVTPHQVCLADCIRVRCWTSKEACSLTTALRSRAVASSTRTTRTWSSSLILHCTTSCTSHTTTTEYTTVMGSYQIELSVRDSHRRLHHQLPLVTTIQMPTSRPTTSASTLLALVTTTQEVLHDLGEHVRLVRRRMDRRQLRFTWWIRDLRRRGQLCSNAGAIDDAEFIIDEDNFDGAEYGLDVLCCGSRMLHVRVHRRLHLGW